MNIAAAISLMSIGCGIAFTIIWLRISRAPGWEAQRYLAAIAATASLYCLGDLAQMFEVSDQVARVGFQVGLASGCLHGIAWLVWFAATQQRPLSYLERIVCGTGISIALLSLVPGLFASDHVSTFSVDWLQVTYHIPDINLPGTLALAYFGLAICLVGWLSFQSWHERRARWGLAAMTILVTAAIHDALVSAQVIVSPLITDACFFVVILGVGRAELQRFVADAQRLVLLSTELESQVVERSDQLNRMQASLARSEKLAALGQLAAGVAHEVNNPAAVVTSNLEFAFTTLESEHRLSDEVKSSLTDSMLATKRIAKIVRQLLDAGRNAGGDFATVLPCDPGLAIGRALNRLRQSFGKKFDVEVNIGKDTRARADMAILEQVMFNLLQNAAHAVGSRDSGGRIAVCTRREGQHVVIEISDNGSGIPADLQHRLFEPFFTTKEFGQGTGLGLAVSLGLMRAQQGDLSLVRSGPEGSVFALSLAWSGDEPSSLHITNAAVTHGGLRLLIIDDDRQIRDSLRRTLAKAFHIEVAAGVDEALERVRNSKDTLDAVLCDILMPDGGGAKVYMELCRMAPELAQRTLFMTGGATSAEAQQFLQAHSERVLLKPLDQARLREAIFAIVRAPLVKQ